MIIGWALADTLCLKLEQTENAIRRLHEQHSAAILYDFQGKHRDPSSKPRYSGLLTDGGGQAGRVKTKEGALGAH
eukprot:3576406-Rhodomonas_salina.2